jgi:hypothetical protein
MAVSFAGFGLRLPNGGGSGSDLAQGQQEQTAHDGDVEEQQDTDEQPMPDIHSAEVETYHGSLLPPLRSGKESVGRIWIEVLETSAAHLQAVDAS